MTTFLTRSESVSTAEIGGYEDNESVTSLPHLAEQILQDLEHQRSRSTDNVENTGTAIEQREDDLQSGGHGWQFWTRQEAGLVRLQVMRPAIPGYQAAATLLSQDPEFHFSFPFWELTSPEDSVADQPPGGSSSAGSSEGIHHLLRDALDALYEVKSVAQEEDCDEPSDLGINNAEAVLRQMFKLSARVYDIYPMGGGEVAIDAGNRGRRIGVFCYPDGRMQYVVLLDDERKDIRKDDVQDIPIDLLDRALNQLDS
jgi:hypothetical protein